MVDLLDFIFELGLLFDGQVFDDEHGKGAFAEVLKKLFLADDGLHTVR